MFPIDMQGTIEISARSPDDAPSILDGIERELAREGVEHIARTQDGLVFRIPFMLRSGRWSALAPFESGRVEVIRGMPTRIRYRFSTIQLLGLVALMSAVFGLFAFAFGGKGPAVNALALCWLWLFGGNWVLGAIRLPRFLRRAAEGPGHGPGRCHHCDTRYDPRDYRPGATWRCDACNEELR